MLPQKNVPSETLEEEKIHKTTEEPISNFKTPKKNPALQCKDAIDRLLLFSPSTPCGTVSKEEEPTKKEVRFKKKKTF